MIEVRFVKACCLVAIFFSCLLIVSCDKNKSDDNPISTNGPFAIEIGDSEIPYIVITTKEDIKNEPKVEAEMKIYEKKVQTTTQTIGIEYKGKTSFRLSDKKSYSIETRDAEGKDISVSLLNLPPEEDWNLIGNVVNLKDKFFIDRTMLFNYVSYELSRSIGKYAARCKLVELEIDNQYKGVYLFTEKIKRDKNRVDIKSNDGTSNDISGGYILSIDKSSIGKEGIGKPLSYFENNWQDDAKYNSTNSFRSKFDINGNLITFAPYGPPYHQNKYLETYFLYEYPGADLITTQQKNYIENYIYEFESAFLKDDFNNNKREYLKYIDINSFIDYFIINEVSRNVDAYRLSTYLYKDRGGKLFMGPVWDMNIGFNEGDRIPLNGWVMEYNKYVTGDAWMVHFWWPRLLSDPFFRSELKKRWDLLRKNELSDAVIFQLIDNQAKYLQNNGAVKRNYDKWDPFRIINYENSIKDMKNYIQQRTAWMDAEISKF